MTASPSSLDSEDSFLILDSLVKKFGPEIAALSGVSLSIRRGEFVCFLGPSGCGKTTLLRLIAGLDYQTSGRIWQGGRDISWLPPQHRDFGIVFQSYALFPNLTVADNISYGLVNQKAKKETIAGRVDELLQLVNLSAHRHKYPWQLSGGEQQRVALVRALAISPSLLLLDEPLSALDTQVRAYLRTEIRALQKHLGVTTIMVTHDQEEAMTMADRVVVIDRGSIKQIGTPEEIYRNPADVFVAGFIGVINLLPCRVVEDGAVEICGIKLHCPGASGAGKEAQIAIRPEDIVVHAKAPANNGLAVCVEKIEFLGAFSRVHLAHRDGPVFIADCARSMMHDFPAAQGQTVHISILPEHLRLYPAAS